MHPEYPNIDLQKTGRRIQTVIRTSGYSVRDVQEYLHLACPQPIYRWFKGLILPSVNHIYALSLLLHVHMEDLLVVQNEKLQECTADNIRVNRRRWILLYYHALCDVA